MPKQKKQKRVVRKNKKVATSDPGPTEYEGWKIGDIAWWCMASEATPRQGEIVKFHPNDNIGPAVSLDDMSGAGRRVALVQFIFDNKKAAKESRAEFNKFWKDYKEGKR